MVNDISVKISNFEDEKADLTEYQKSTLEQYLSKDFTDIKNAPIIL